MDKIWTKNIYVETFLLSQFCINIALYTAYYLTTQLIGSSDLIIRLFQSIHKRPDPA